MEQQRRWEESIRFEELESDSDDDEGVQLSDPLYRAESDSRPSSRRVYEYSDDSDSDSADEEIERGTGEAGDTQLAMREKEEVLVQRAMERIRRAQALGKANVKLPPQERDALERKLASDRARGRKSLLAPSNAKAKASPEARRSTSRSNLAVAKSSKAKGSRTSLTRVEEAASSAPGMLVPGPNGEPVFAQIGYYPPGSSQPELRSVSSQNMAHHLPPKRQNSGPEPSTGPRAGSGRVLPDDPSWEPRSRSSSGAAGGYAYTVDAYGYPLPVNAMPPQYMHGPPLPPGSRRNITYPSDPAYGGMRAAYDPRLRREPSNDEDDSSSGRSGSSGGDNRGVQLEAVAPARAPARQVTQRRKGKGRR